MKRTGHRVVKTKKEADKLMFVEQGKTHASLQWKGTDACIDIYCKCGARLHADDYFLYNIECPYCNTAYALNPRIELIEVTEEDIYPVLIERDDYMDEVNKDLING